jgi:uncharacterized protein YndB with AHSA1/START domain
MNDWKHSSARRNKRREASMDAITESILVEREVAIPASPETVWQLLVDPEQATRWMGWSATFACAPAGVTALR